MNEQLKSLIIHRLEMAKETLKDALVLYREGRSFWSIVNRAYYAILALLTSIGKVPSKHAGAIVLFDRHFVKTGKFPTEMSKWLHKAFDLRQRSDYREMYSLNAEQVAEVLQQAQEFVREVEVYLTTQLQEGKGGY